MIDDVRRRILRDREQRANMATDSPDSPPDSPHLAGAALHHALSAVHDLPTEININTMDPAAREAFMTAYHPNAALLSHRERVAFLEHADIDRPVESRQ
jgi:hypothetical protein